MALRATGAPAAAVRAAAVLLGVELAQGVVGFVQYFTAAAGRCWSRCTSPARALTLVAAVRVVLATRDRGPLAVDVPDDARALQPA